MAEIRLEAFALALETVRGTKITPPTHRINGNGTLTPMVEIYRPDDKVGSLAEFQRDEIVRKWAEWGLEGALDVWSCPVLFNMLLEPKTTGTVQGGTTAYLWEFKRGMTSDALKSASMYFGDPNQKIYEAPFGMAQEFSWAADASGTDGATMSCKGIAQFPAQANPTPTIPAAAMSPILVPAKMQLWLDTSSPIGTTEVTGRVVSASGSFATGVAPKYLATGPAGGITYARVGRQAAHPEMTVQVDMPDQVQYTLFENGSLVKARCRVNGPLIESTYYNYFEQDIYGKMSSVSWGDLEGNRTFEFTILGIYDSTAATDTRVAIMNNKTGL